MKGKKTCKHQSGLRTIVTFKIRKTICLDCGKLINKETMSKTITREEYLAFKNAKINKCYGNVIDVMKALEQQNNTLNREKISYMFIYESELDKRFKLKTKHI